MGLKSDVSLSIYPCSPTYQVRVNGKSQPVFRIGNTDITLLESEGDTPLEVHVPYPIPHATLHPQSLGIYPEPNGQVLSFVLPGPGHYILQVPNYHPLFIYVNSPNLFIPKRGKIHRIPSGTIVHARDISLKSGETLFIESGAILQGNLRLSGLQDICICGGGILDGGWRDSQPPSTHRNRLLVIEGCKNVNIRDLILIHPESWMLVLGRCSHVQIYNVRSIGQVISSDGIDIVGSQHVLIENCCLRNNDDCIAIKSTPGDHPLEWDWCGNVEDIRVHHCILWNDQSGNALEIGHELQADYIRNIQFQDIDILCVHGYGAPFSIHNGDRAIVENILYKNIRVEHHYDKLFDLRILHSRYSRDSMRGYIRNIRFEDIKINESTYNPGYTVSIIGGWDADHPIDGVHFKNVWIGKRNVLSPEDIPLYTAHCQNITFVP